MEHCSHEDLSGFDGGGRVDCVSGPVEALKESD